MAQWQLPLLTWMAEASSRYRTMLPRPFLAAVSCVAVWTVGTGGSSTMDG